MEQNKKNIIVYIVINILAIALLISLMYSFNLRNKVNEQTNLNNSLNDSVMMWKDKDSLNHAKIAVITTERTKDFLALKGLTGENKKLQESVAKYEKQIKNGGSVTNFTSNTKVDTKAPTQVTTETKTENGVKKEYPVYTSRFDLDGWVTGSTKAKVDSTEINLKIKNEYTVVIGEDKTGFLGLGKAKPFVEVVNLNPYSETPLVKTYSVDVSKKKNNLWIYTALAGVVAGILIAK